MTITLNRNWVNSLVVSLPEYADELGKNIQAAMTGEVLDEIDAHTCALAAAIADRNGELAFEIAMSDVLRGNDVREEIAKAVVDLMIDERNALENPSLYTLAIAYVLNIHVADVEHCLIQQGVDAQKLAAVIRIASLVPAISRCVI